MRWWLASLFILVACRPAPGQAGAWDYRGMAIQLASGYQPVETYGPLLTEVRSLGANSVLLSIAGYMEHARSQAIYADARRAPSPEALRTLLRQAREADLKVILMPIVLLSHPRGNEWRGVIDPPDWDDWWRQYREFILMYADLAATEQVEAFMVGSELVSSEKFTDRWRALIAEVRARYRGRLGYSANWDHYKPIRFWGDLDFVGMTSYHTLADHKLPSVEQVVRRWEEIRADLLQWRRGVDRPLLFTEVGWCSQEGAATAPWNYYHRQKATADGLEEQRRLYEAFIEAWDDADGLAGVIWWEWPPGEGGVGDHGYTPRGKPAEQVLRDWFAAQRRGESGS